VSPAIVGLDASGAPDAWRAAGFTVDEGADDGVDVVTIGQVRVRIGGAGTGIAGWTLAGVPAVTTGVDGLATRVAEPASSVEPSDVVATAAAHPNRATLIDHVVVWTADDARTIDALAAVGFEVRRVREDARPGLRQTFVRAGDVIIELVTRADLDPPADPHPARFFGLACTVADLDACALLLGDALGPITDAVQPGRRIATLQGKAIGLEVPIAFMSAAQRPLAEKC
jgi:hypothetical protein